MINLLFTIAHRLKKMIGPFLLASSIGMAFGNADISRICCLGFSVLKFSHLLLNQAAYNNHEYMYASLSLLLAITDCHRLSLLISESNRKFLHRSAVITILVSTTYLMCHNGTYGINGKVAIIGMIPIWASLSVLIGKKPYEPSQGQVAPWNYSAFHLYFATIYFYAGLTKTSLDWLSGSLPRELLLGHAGYDWILRRWCSSLNIAEDRFFVLFAYSAMVFDLTAGFALAAPSKVTRVLFTIAAVLFHGANHFLFVIETFPWVMISSCVIYHSPHWMDDIDHFVDALHNSKLFEKLSSLGLCVIRRAALFFASVFILMHAAMPLLCGLESILDPGVSSWGSQCAYFNWRMMSRAVKTVTCQFRIASSASLLDQLAAPLLDRAVNISRSALRKSSSDRVCRTLPRLTAELVETVVVTLDSLGYASEQCRAEVDTSPDCRAGKDFLIQTPQYEDRLWLVTKDLRRRTALLANTNTNIDPSSPSHSSADRNVIFADVWLEVNGPPIQRFVKPYFDISTFDSLSFEPTFSLERWQRAVHNLWSRCLQLEEKGTSAGSVPWQFPRLTMFRSLEWQDRFRRLEEQERADFAAHVASTCFADGTESCNPTEEARDLRVVFVADVPSSSGAVLSFDHPTRIKVIHGTAYFDHDQLGLLRKDEEILIKGNVLWYAAVPFCEDEEEEEDASCRSTAAAFDANPCLIMITLTRGVNTFSIA